MADLLLELLSEEIPARMQAKAALDLVRLVGDGLAAADVTVSSMRGFVTPRRLTLVAEGMPLATPDIAEERRGPRVGAPAAALEGFLKSADVTLEQCEQRDTGKGVFHFAVIRRPGRPTADVLRTVVESVLATFPWPKSMRWGAHPIRWVRPLHAILCLFDGHVVPLTFGPLTAADQTVGHRFLAPRPFKVAAFADYAQKLASAKVMLDPVVRRQAILDQATAAATREGLRVRPDDGLLDEVCGLVEWPRVLTGTIDASFLAIPDEVLITSMRAHQKYLSLLRADGRLANRFLIVANIDSADGGAAIVAGNERVLRARLSDASFFWDSDRSVRLESRLPKLVERIFYQGLGTVADKAVRLEALAASIARAVGADPALAARAARLAKADLSSSMVGEFPELQGIMGRYYALHDGEPLSVAEAIADHYAPQGPAEGCPSAPVSVAVALADKIDTLVGFFALGEKPSGSKDPFALRRAALGVIRLILENDLRLSLRDVMLRAQALYRVPLPRAADEAADDLLAFFADRLKVHLRERGVRHDLVTATFALGEEDDLVRLVSRVGSLQAFLASDDGANLLIAFRRAANIVRIEEKKDGTAYDFALPPSAPVTAAATEWDLDLVHALARADGDLQNALAREDFAAAMGHMAALRGPVDRFFDKVTVNSGEAEARVQRLRLLAGVRRVMNLVADFSCVEA